MNHKRGRPKNRRAGCLTCKPQKANGAKGKERERPTVRRRKQPESFYCQDCGAEDAAMCRCERG